MKYYVVLCNWSLLSGEFGTDIIGIAHSLEEAREIFDKAVIDYKANAEYNNWEIYEDSDVEFDAGAKSYYRLEHTNLYIEGVLQEKCI